LFSRRVRVLPGVIAPVDRFDYRVGARHVAQRNDRTAETRACQPRSERAAAPRALHDRVEALRAAFKVAGETTMRRVHQLAHFIEMARLKRVRRTNHP